MNRRSARVILFNEQGRVLLLRGADSTTAERQPWWFTPGGGLEPGETPHEAALREVKEETGLTLQSLSGPVYEHEMNFTFEGTHLQQYEQFFIAHVHDAHLSSAGWTDLEKRTVLESRWWSLDELERSTEKIYPETLAHLVREELGGVQPTSLRRL